MDEAPDFEAEYEALYAQEMEMMRELEGFDEEEAAIEAASIPRSKKRSLDFTSPPPPTTTTTRERGGDQETPQEDTTATTSISSSSSRKRGIDYALIDELDRCFDRMDRSSGSSSNKRYKRSSSSLLPDILLEVDNSHYQERLRHQENLKIIAKIVERRQEDTREANAHTTTTTLPSLRKNRRTIHQRVPPERAFQAVTTEDGVRCYVTCVEEEEWERSIAAVAAAAQRTPSLLTANITALKAQAQREQIRQDAIQARRLQEEDSGLESGPEEESVGSSSEALWVDRYKPRRYLHLLSDESTNRTVLQWIKLWDKVVFNRDIKCLKKKENGDGDDDNNNNNFNNNNRKNKKKGKFKKFIKKSDIIEEVDDNNRPVQKVLLLCGPPGLGKTTLAHIAASHAGYNVVEMNASDDTSVEAFRSRLENATTMRAVLGTNPRPNCLVIDEIDGAPAPSINLLVSMLSGKDIRKKVSKKAKGPILLQRPIICICNELYTPALRPLRQMALLVKFPPTHTTRLAQRLFEISRQQRLKADLSLLLNLCEKTENDIRSCLSILQFVKSNKKCLSMSDISSVSVGQKDYQRSLFKIWQEIFSIPRPKRIRNNPLEQESGEVLVPMPEDLRVGGESSLSFRLQHILKVTQHAPYERVVQGWFENYLTLREFTLMDAIADGLDWTLFVDIQLREVMHSQAWVLMAYLPFACVAYHFRFGSLTWSNVKFPTQMQEMNQKLTKNQTLLSGMVREMPPLCRAFTGTTQLVCDVLPMLTHIIQPVSLRPVNTQLYSTHEKHELTKLVDVMIAYNLTYMQEKDPATGHYHFKMDPDLGEIVHFGEGEQGGGLSYYSRQLIAREIELEKVRRSERYFYRDNDENDVNKLNKESNTTTTTTTTTGGGGSSDGPTKQQPSTSSSSEVIPNFKQKLQPLIRDEEILNGERLPPQKDFFGRVVEKNREHSNQAANKVKVAHPDIWFKYNEGYCNAVRKTTYMEDLLIKPKQNQT